MEPKDSEHELAALPAGNSSVLRGTETVMTTAMKTPFLVLALSFLGWLCLVLWATLKVVSVWSTSRGDLLLVILVLALTSGTAFFLGLSLYFRNREQQRELRAATARRGQTEELRLAAVGLAHETKNPLGIIRGLAQQVAADPRNPPEARQKAREMIEAADVTTARLGDFMSYAKLRTPELVELDAVPHIEAACNLMRDDCRNGGIELIVTVDPIRILADPDMLSQVLLNLLNNSLKATSPGGRVRVSLKQTERRRAVLVLNDTGVGIAGEFLPHIFEPYTSKRSGGYGIGLAIVKKIADESGWDIRVTSTEGEGTEFRITGIVVM